MTVGIIIGATVFALAIGAIVGYSTGERDGYDNGIRDAQRKMRW